MNKIKNNSSGSALIQVMVAGSISLLAVGLILKTTQQRLNLQRVSEIKNVRDEISEEIRSHLKDQDVIMLSAGFSRNDNKRKWNQTYSEKTLDQREFVFAGENVNYNPVGYPGNEKFASCLLGKKLSGADKEREDPEKSHRSNWSLKTTQSFSDWKKDYDPDEERILEQNCVAKIGQAGSIKSGDDEDINWQEIVILNPIDSPSCLNTGTSTEISQGCYLAGKLSNDLSVGYSIRRESGFKSRGKYSKNFPLKVIVEFAPRCDSKNSIKSCTFAHSFLFRIKIIHPALVQLAKINKSYPTESSFKSEKNLTSRKYNLEISRSQILESSCNPGAKITGISNTGDMICACAHPFKPNRDYSQPGDPIFKNSHGPLCERQDATQCPSDEGSYLIGIDPSTNEAICSKISQGNVLSEEFVYNSDDEAISDRNSCSGTNVIGGPEDGWISQLKHECVAEFTFTWTKRWKSGWAAKAAGAALGVRAGQLAGDIIGLIPGIGPILGTIASFALPAIGGLIGGLMADPPPPYEYNHYYMGLDPNGTDVPVANYPKCWSVKKPDNIVQPKGLLDTPFMKGLSIALTAASFVPGSKTFKKWAANTRVGKLAASVTKKAGESWDAFKKASKAKALKKARDTASAARAGVRFVGKGLGAAGKGLGKAAGFVAEKSGVATRYRKAKEWRKARKLVSKKRWAVRKENFKTWKLKKAEGFRKGVDNVKNSKIGLVLGMYKDQMKDGGKALRKGAKEAGGKAYDVAAAPVRSAAKGASDLAEKAKYQAAKAAETFRNNDKVISAKTKALELKAKYKAAKDGARAKWQAAKDWTSAKKNKLKEGWLYRKGEWVSKKVWNAAKYTGRNLKLCAKGAKTTGCRMAKSAAYGAAISSGLHMLDDDLDDDDEKKEKFAYCPRVRCRYKFRCSYMDPNVDVGP
jgi:hypothetical protein